MPTRPTLLLLAALALPGAAQEAAPAEPAAPQSLAFTGAVVHSMVDGEEPAVRTVVVVEDRIQALLLPGAPLPEGCEEVALDGLHLVPGLIDGCCNHDVEHDALYVSKGVTLVRDIGNDVHDILLQRLPEQRALVPGPDLFIAGPTLEGVRRQTSSSLPVVAPADAETGLPSVFERLAAEATAAGLQEDDFRFDFLCFQPNLPADAWRALVAVAHRELQLEVWGPIPSAVTLKEALEAGQDGFLGLQALLPPQVRDWREVTLQDLQPAIAAMGRSSVEVTPLVGVYSRMLADRSEDEKALRLLSPVYAEVWRPLSESWAAQSDQQRALVEGVVALQRQAVLHLWRAGVPLVPGSGTPNAWLVPGRALLEELDQWVLAGIPTREVLRLATAGAADALGVEAQRGRIAPGLVADLVAVGSDPRETLAGLRDPELVVLRGRLLERWDLEERLTATIAGQDEARALLTAPLEIPLPELTDGKPLLSGYSETQSYGQRLSGERFVVFALDDGKVAYCTRMILPATLTTPEHAIQLVQVFRGDRLERYQLDSIPRMEEGDQGSAMHWQVEGARVGESSRMIVRRRSTTGHFETKTTDDPIGIVDFSDALTAIILGQHAPEGTLYALSFEGATFEPLADRWAVKLNSENHALEVTTSRGGLLAGLGANGAPIVFARRDGQAVTEIDVSAVETHGGSGLELPEGRLFIPAEPEPGDEEGPADAEGGGEGDR